MADIPLLSGMWSQLNLSLKTCAVFDVCSCSALSPKLSNTRFTMKLVSVKGNATRLLQTGGAPRSYGDVRLFLITLLLNTTS